MAQFGTTTLRQIYNVPSGGTQNLSPIPRPSPVPAPTFAPDRGARSVALFPIGASTGTPRLPSTPIVNPSAPTILTSSSPSASGAFGSDMSSGMAAPNSGTDGGVQGAVSQLTSGLGSNWWIWLLVGVAAFWLLAQPKELRIKA